MIKAIERDFPFEEIDPVAERESYRKEVNRPIYHTHKWWAQRLGSVFRALVLGSVLPEQEDIWKNFYTKGNYTDKIILDPFMGSGTTLGEATKLGCKVIGCDINPVSSFIVGQSLKSIPATKLVEAYNALEKRVKKKILQYYQRIHPVTGEPCQILYYFWVKVVELPNGKQVPLFSSYVFSKNAYTAKKPLSKILCPNCFSILEDRFDVVNTTCGDCNHTFNPQDGPAKGQYVLDKETNELHKIITLVKATKKPLKHIMYASMILNSEGKKEYLKIDEEDHLIYQSATQELERSNLLVPQGKIEPGHNTNQVLNYNYNYWREFFNDRQLLGLGYLLEGILEFKEKDIREAFLSLFSGTLEFNNMFCSFKGEGTGAVRHLFSNHILKPERTPLENSIWGSKKSSGTFFSLFKSRLLKAQEYREKPFEIKVSLDSKSKSDKAFCSNPIRTKYIQSFEELLENDNSCLVLNGDSSQLPLPDGVIDAVITDPPYFDFVHYSELSDFFYAWLKPVLKEQYSFFGLDSSRRIGEVQQKESSKFSNALSNVFSESRRVLKEDGLLIFSFHHSKLQGWLSIYEAIESAGFCIYKAYPVKAEMSVSAPKTSAKSPINLDAIFICKKRVEAFSTVNALLTTVEFIKDSALNDYNSFKARFDAVGRTLSTGDKKVIFTSQLLKHCSLANFSYEEIANIFDDEGIEAMLGIKLLQPDIILV